MVTYFTTLGYNITLSLFEIAIFYCCALLVLLFLATWQAILPIALLGTIILFILIAFWRGNALEKDPLDF